MKAIVLFMVSLLFIWLRCILDTSPELIRYIGAINVIALIYVLGDMIFKISSSWVKWIRTTKYIVSKKKEMIRNGYIICVVCFIFILFMGYLYIKSWASGKFNDILSIIALALSLISDEIVGLFIARKNGQADL